eukprot:1158475-Pelagomonas_calceolata.AAC.2
MSISARGVTDRCKPMCKLDMICSMQKGCGSGVLWTFFWLASVHRVSEQECSSRRPSLDCGVELCSFLWASCVFLVALLSAHIFKRPISQRCWPYVNQCKPIQLQGCPSCVCCLEINLWPPSSPSPCNNTAQQFALDLHHVPGVPREDGHLLPYT